MPQSTTDEIVALSERFIAVAAGAVRRGGACGRRPSVVDRLTAGAPRGLASRAVQTSQRFFYGSRTPVAVALR